MASIEDYDDLDHILASRTSAGKALRSLSTYIDLQHTTLPHLQQYSTNTTNTTTSSSLGTSAHTWLLDKKKSMALHNGMVAINGEIREVHTALEKDEVRERRRLTEMCKYAHTICNYHSVVEPKERSKLVAEEVAIRRDIDTMMRRSRSQEVPLLISSNLMLQVLDMERVELHREFTETLETILLAEGLDREDLVASMVRRGKDPFRSPTLQGMSSSNHADGGGQQQPPPPYASNHSHRHYPSHTSSSSNHQPPHSLLLPTEFYCNNNNGSSSGPSASIPHFVSGGSGRYNPNSPQPSRTNASHGGTYQGSHTHQSAPPYQQPMLGVPLGRPAPRPSSSSHYHPQQRPPSHNPQHHHPSRHNTNNTTTTNINGTTATHGSYTSSRV